MTCRVLALAVILAALPGCAAVAGDVPGDRGGQVPAIRALLNQHPGVEVLDAEGWDSFWPFTGPEDIWVDLRLGTNGKMLLCDLSLYALNGGGYFGIARVGDWRPRTESDGDRWKAPYTFRCVGASEVRVDSALTELMPFPLRSPSDAIANYERLHAAIAAWPDARTERRSAHGGVITYWKERYRPDFQDSR